MCDCLTYTCVQRGLELLQAVQAGLQLPVSSQLSSSSAQAQAQKTMPSPDKAVKGPAAKAQHLRFPAEAAAEAVAEPEPEPKPQSKPQKAQKAAKVCACWLAGRHLHCYRHRAPLRAGCAGAEERRRPGRRLCWRA